jgi:hypothetical protein
MTPSGIEPATFRFVAQNLNHCATAVPNWYIYIYIYIYTYISEITLNIRSIRVFPYCQICLIRNFGRWLQKELKFDAPKLKRFELISRSYAWILCIRCVPMTYDGIYWIVIIGLISTRGAPWTGSQFKLGSASVCFSNWEWVWREY